MGSGAELIDPKLNAAQGAGAVFTRDNPRLGNVLER